MKFDRNEYNYEVGNTSTPLFSYQLVLGTIAVELM